MDPEALGSFATGKTPHRRGRDAGTEAVRPDCWGSYEGSHFVASKHDGAGCLGLAISPPAPLRAQHREPWRGISLPLGSIPPQSERRPCSASHRMHAAGLRYADSASASADLRSASRCQRHWRGSADALAANTVSRATNTGMGRHGKSSLRLNRRNT